MSMRLLTRLTPAGKGKFISARTFAAPVRPGGLCHLPLPFPPAYSFCVRRRQNGRKLFRTESEPFCAKSRSRNCGFKTGVCARAPARVCVCVCSLSVREIPQRSRFVTERNAANGTERPNHRRICPRSAPGRGFCAPYSRQSLIGGTVADVAQLGEADERS